MFISKAAFKDMFREASRRLSRFFSIFAIVAIGIGFFVGIKATSPDMKLTADKYYKETNLMDLKLFSPLGFEKEDAEAILFTEGVDSIMPSYSMDSLMSVRGSNMVVKVHAVPKPYKTDAPFNMPILVSGRMPEQAGECVIEESNIKNPFMFRLGDIIRLLPSQKNDDLAKVFKTDAFTIVGFVNSPEYISMERGVSTIGSGAVYCYIMILPEDFNLEVYTEIHIGLLGTHAISTFSEEYSDIIASSKAKLEVLAEERGVIRYNHVKSETSQRISDGKVKLLDAETEMNEKLLDAQAEIDAAKEEINAAETNLRDGEAKFETEIEDAQAKLEDGYDRYYKAKAQYDKDYKAFQSQKSAAQAQIAQGERDLDQLGSEINQLQSISDSMPLYDPRQFAVLTQLSMLRYQYAQGSAQLSQAKSDLASGEQKLKNANKQLQDSKRKLDKGKEELEQTKIDTQKQIDDAKIEIIRAKAELANGEKEYAKKKAEAEQKLYDAKRELEDAEKLLRELEIPKWVILTREDNPGYLGYKNNAERLDGVATLFPLFFLLVAGLVCFTTMMRMVEEQRGQIGIYKALGYSCPSIAVKYFTYAMVAALFGSVLGVIIGHILFPKVIYRAFDIMYSLPSLTIALPLNIAAASTAAAVISTALAAVLACDSELRLMPASLMRPKAQKPGKRVFAENLTFVWSRLSFFSKLTVRNLFRYKIRFAMTVLGISGCMALMVAGFGLKDSVNAIVPNQFGEINLYDIVLKLKGGLLHKDIEQLKEKLQADDRIAQAMFASTGSFDVQAKKEKTRIDLFVPQEPDRLKSFITLRDRRSSKPIELTNKGAVISEKLAKVHNLKTGDTIVLKSSAEEYSVPIEGICENYVQHYVYMTPQCYKKTFLKEPVYNTIITLALKDNPKMQEKLMEDWLMNDNVIIAYSISSITKEFKDSIKGLNVVVLVMIFSAGLLAFAVLYNLTNINISERIREIATAKVLGFHSLEVARFVFGENVILSLIGIAAGSVLGAILHGFVVESAEVDIVMFGRGVAFINYIKSGILALAFTILVNFIMRFRLKKISMVESLKSMD